MGLKLEEVVGKKLTEEQFDEAAGKKDACYHKVKARYDVWPSAYASGALVKCRKVGAANWGNKSKKEGVNEGPKIDSRLRKGLTKIQDDSYKLLANYRTVPGIEKLVDAWMDGLHRSMKQLGIMKESVNEGSYEEKQIMNQLKGDDLTLQIKSSKGKTNFLKLTPEAAKKIAKIMKTMIPESVNEEKNFPKSLVDKAIRIAKSMGGNMTGAVKKINSLRKGLSRDGKVAYALRVANESVNQDVFFESTTEGNVTTAHIHWESNGKGHGYTVEYVNDGKLNEAEYQGRKVKLGKIMQGDAKKFKVYVKNPKGNVVKVNFGQGGDAKGGTMRIRKSNPDARKSFRARHNCDNPGPRHKARYWSCRKW